MLAWLLLAAGFLLGVVLVKVFLPFLKKTPYFWGAVFFVGLWATGTILFALKGQVVLFLLICFLFLFWQRQKLRLKLPAQTWWGVFLVSFLFCWWFFSRTFAYRDNTILVASNQYLDFGAHVPIIRSFSQGDNFPPELPFYAATPISYHFLFDFTTAMFEKTGWSIALAYNLLSALSLTFIFMFLFYFSQQLFVKKSKLLGFLSALFFLLTADLSFLFFFKKHGLDSLLINLRNHNIYLNNGLTVDKFFGGFFNINVFTNQRHLVFGLGLFLLFILALRQTNLKKRSLVFLGILFGLLPFWHSFTFLAVGLVGVVSLLLVKNKKDLFLLLFVVGLAALPQFWFIRRYTGNQIVFQPGFLMDKNLSLVNWLKFWLYNFGVGLPLMVVGWWLAPKKVKKFLLPILFLFVAPNLFHFAREPFNDHKFFNLFIMFGNLLAARCLIWLWQKKLIFKVLALGIFVIFIASGILNLLVVKNDVWVSFADSGSFLQWVREGTRPDDLFLTNLEMWDPVNLAGRKKFLGRPHYIWAYGGDPSSRMMEKEEILAGRTPLKSRAAQQPEIDFFAFQKDGEEYNRIFFENLPKVYQNKDWVVYRFSLPPSGESLRNTPEESWLQDENGVVYQVVLK